MVRGFHVCLYAVVSSSQGLEQLNLLAGWVDSRAEAGKEPRLTVVPGQQTGISREDDVCVGSRGRVE